jgi:FkbM family methyltransferase
MSETSTPGLKQRPLWLRLCPVGLRTALYYRFYRTRRGRWEDLYARAPLHFAPGMVMRLRPTDEGHSEIAFTGLYELALSRALLTHARTAEAGLMVDVGGNYGYFALLWAAASRQHRVIAFEASPRNHAALHENVRLNGLEQQIDVRDLALGQAAGELAFSLGGDEQTGWGSFAVAGAVQEVRVPVVTLDSQLPPDATVEALKIDVEGADTWVLYGARRLLEEKRVKHIYFEQNKDRMASLGIEQRAPLEFLAGLGYKVAPLTDPGAVLVEYHAWGEGAG